MLIPGRKGRIAWLAAGAFFAGAFFSEQDKAWGLPATDALNRFWATDGAVHAMVVTNGTLYLGGDFHYVGPTTGSGAAVDAVTGSRIDGFPVVNGPVYAV